MVKAVLILPGTAVVLVSGLITWAAVNSVYFPLSEEKGLERRFGDDYRTYKANVPRWIPRVTAWRPPDEP
jgi:protein-S-isoprenylcysteine O-methyltransferase Ste14